MANAITVHIVTCVASVSVGSRGKELQREKRERRGRGRKEMLADKPLDFENRPLNLSCVTDFMLSSSIQVVFVILVLARLKIYVFVWITVFFCTIRIIQGCPK